MSDPTSNFDEPSLKQAVRTVAGSHRASDALRARIAQTLASAEIPATRDAPSTRRASPEEDRAPMRIGPSPARRFLSIAAALIVGLGLCYMAFDSYTAYRQRHPAADAYAISDKTINAMLRADALGSKLDTSSAGAAHDVRALNAPTTDAAALAREASDALHRPVPTPKLEGWTIDRAALSEVAGFEGARFHFTKGKQSATLLSLPAEAWPGRMTDHYCAAPHEQQAIAGYVAGTSLNCVIGDPSLSTADVDALVSSLRNQ